MNAYPLSLLASLVGSSSSHLCGDPLIEILLTDSRSLTFPDRTLFIAIETAKGDGHRYIDTLYQRGVRSFLVSKEVSPLRYPGASFVRCTSGIEALQRIAAYHRSTLSTTVVGITGSNGKTTLKEILYQLLHRYRRVGRSPKSYNSAIGVPLSLWGLSTDAEIALIEAGISQPGEMAVLELMVRPEIGILTHIGEAHQENFPSLAAKCREKVQLFVHSSVIICGGDDPLISSCLAELPAGKLYYTWSRLDPTASLYLQSIEYHDESSTLSFTLGGQQRTLEVPYTDQGTIEDLLLALLLLYHLVPEVLDSPELFRELDPISMRLEVLEGDAGTLLINDTYNSDYDSLAIALDYMARRNPHGNDMVLILSDIQESSPSPAELYGRVASLLSLYPLAHVYAVGSQLSRYASLFSTPITTYHTTDELLATLDRSAFAHKTLLLKGARRARFERIVRLLEKHTHQTILDVNLSHLTHNFNYYRSLLPQGTRMVAMVKAFGYGTGSIEIARTLSEAACDYLAVAVVDEGKQLREQSVSLPIIVMNPERAAFSQLLEYRLQPEIYSLSLLRSFIAAVEAVGEQHYPIHLKWDTGMHRLGFAPEMLPEVLALLSTTSAVRVASIFTHLAVADDSTQDDFTRLQLSRLHTVRTTLAEQLSYPFYTHALNTAGISRFPSQAMDMVRLGLGLYGISPLPGGEEALRTVVSLRTVILQIQTLACTETVGYGRRGKLSRPSRIGILPIGYADGVDRRLGNGTVTFRTAHGVLVPTIGNICMDTLMIDLTDDPQAQEGDEVTIFDDALPLSRLSTAMGTIPYEIIARLSPRISRRYFNE